MVPISNVFIVCFIPSGAHFLLATQNIVREEATLIDANGVRAVEFSMEAGSTGPLHTHSEVVEHCYCLSGTLIVDIEGQQSTTLAPGMRCSLPVGQAHRVRNGGEELCRFLVIQGVGRFDFKEVPKVS